VVRAADGGATAVNSEFCEVFITVVDINEFTPTFAARYFFSETVHENQPVGTFVFTAKVRFSTCIYSSVQAFCCCIGNSLNIVIKILHLFKQGHLEVL